MTSLTSFRPIRLSKIESFRATEFVNPSVNSTFRIQRPINPSHDSGKFNSINLPKPTTKNPSTFFQEPLSASNVMVSIDEESSLSLSLPVVVKPVAVSTAAAAPSPVVVKPVAVSTAAATPSPVVVKPVAASSSLSPLSSPESSPTPMELYLEFQKKKAASAFPATAPSPSTNTRSKLKTPATKATNVTKNNATKNVSVLQKLIQSRSSNV